jgi:hypothetical protein
MLGRHICMTAKLELEDLRLEIRCKKFHKHKIT